MNVQSWLTGMNLATCPHCGGSGKCLDDKRVGRHLRDARTGRQITLREVARRMGFSAAYLSDLELGRRGWDAELVKNYFAAINL